MQIPTEDVTRLAEAVVKVALREMADTGHPTAIFFQKLVRAGAIHVVVLEGPKPVSS